MRPISPISLISLIALLLCALPAKAQIQIGGNVYGGGNEGKVEGNSTVTVRSGDLNKVFGGARQADVDGHAFVNIDGEHASDYVLINYVYGGNDISGTIGTNSELPPELTQASENHIDNSWNAFVRISAKWTAPVHYSAEEIAAAEEGDDAYGKTTDDIKTPSTLADDNQKIYIGQLFGAGNGDYTYETKTETTGEGDETVTTTTYIAKDKDEEVASSTIPLSAPELAKTYLELLGGSIVYAYGGGNNATVTEKTVICVDNPSAVVNHIMVKDGEVVADNTAGATDLLDDTRLYSADKMNLNPGYSYPNRAEYQIGRLFGGNNKAPMSIRPTWKLKSGKVRELFSGGNRGDMNSPDGLLLQIPATSTIEVGTVYGGCRMANVIPKENGKGKEITADPITSDDDGSTLSIPGGMAARTRILGGHITNVYGGNDITGRVSGGSSIGIYTTIYGDVYGGGNGSYPYTDNEALKNDPTYGDLYYDKGSNSVEALNAFRPNAEQVSIYVSGTEDNPTIIHGSVYCGGNSATLHSDIANPKVELKIGKYAIIENVFLGNNGEHMVETHMKNTNDDNPDIWQYHDGVLRTYSQTLAEIDTTRYSGNTSKFSTLTLTNSSVFAQYMEGCAMDRVPSVVFAKTVNRDPEDYIAYSTSIGSFYCGGNRGSMIYAGTNKMDFSVPVYIYNKVVGGCNNALVEEQFADEEQTIKLNARYEGGIIGTTDEQTQNGSGYSFIDDSGNIQDRVVLKFGDGTNGGVQFTPKRWNDDNTALVWNVVDGDGNPIDAPTTLPETNADGKSNSKPEDLNRRLEGGHIYGGCYTSGVVNGNVVINMNSSTVNRSLLFDEVEQDSEGEDILYGESQLTQEEQTFNITKRNTGVLLACQGMDVLGTTLNVFGGGKGKDTEVWGSTTVNLTRGYTFQIFGGSEEGVIGRGDKNPNSSDEATGGTAASYKFNHKIYKYDPKYSCTVNVCGENDGVSKQADQSEAMAQAEFIYGGGFLGPICGNTTVNLGKGRVFDTFAGSCMADILGHTETYIGRQVKNGTVTEGFPYIRDMVYGGNDLGGSIMGEANFTGRVRTTANGGYDAYGKVHNTALLTASAYVEYTQGRADAIFGGHYGTYDYKDSHYRTYFDETGTAKSGYTKPRMGNAFVNFRPTLTDALKTTNTNNYVHRVYGGSQGYPGDADRDIMQRSSYILIDIPDDMDDDTHDHFKHTEVFGGGAWSGLGMEQKAVDGSAMTPTTFNAYSDTQKDSYSACIDLARGQIGAAYGGSLTEGVVRRTWVNVPEGSTIAIGSIFGGAYGTETLSPCDVIEGHVEYHSGDAMLVNDRQHKDDDGNDLGHSMMLGAIYGGNNDQRRTIYAKVNIDVPLRMKHYDYGMTTGTIYGAGYGVNSWAEYTEVNLASGAEVYEVYGGGEEGHVLCAESVQKYMETGKSIQASGKTNKEWRAAWTLGGGYDPASYSDSITFYTGYAANTLTNLGNTTLVRPAEMDDRDATREPYKSYTTYRANRYNTNVIIKQGATVNNYGYGGGLGSASYPTSGDVYGSTYIALLGGKVKKDIYAAGTIGGVYDAFSTGNFTASANAYIAGGTLRNVYGGGWKGDVGYTEMTTTTDAGTGETTTTITKDVPGETHVVIGIRPDQTDDAKLAEIQKVKGTTATKDDYGFACGVPAIQRNAYAGGEGGAVFGTANLVLNNGYIGYAYSVPDGSAVGTYEEKLNDETHEDGVGEGRLRDCGNVFGGGYDVRSSVDFSNVTIWNGTIRNSLHGGGEIATIGRGATAESGEANATRTLNAIYKAGKTTVTMYNGHVKRNVFGGGKGYNIWGYGQQGTLYTDGYVFGQTEVQIHGGEIGTEEGVADGYGNVFGGGDIGYVYSKGYFNSRTMSEKTANPTGSTGSPNHWYYYYNTFRCTSDYGSYHENDEIEASIYENMSSSDQAHWTANTPMLVEDCKVVIAPYLQVMEVATTVNGQEYAPYSYIPTDDLNTLPKKEDGAWTGAWQKLFTETTTGVQRGITIHNAVFGGGNVSSNSDTQYANATTVFGNTTATLYDVYHRDFITVGYEHIGGLYGGGNLSLVDGYRELNITNYGTDYYGLDQQITLEQYRALSSRERAYFQLYYVCTTAEGSYNVNDKLNEEDYFKYIESETIHAANWEPYGFCSIYAGRLLNTVQRADLCGVYGSRMVLQGARDRVADSQGDVYTINRVGELSLNQQRSMAGDSDNGDVHANDAIHGNYFGIYSLVNYLGNLTSDVKFGGDYIDENGVTATDGTTYYSHKKTDPTSRDRNKGQSRNQVALASGVFLELTTENSTDDVKDYGYITGVVELDLINVKRDNVGGGFVYAKNEHRVPKYFPNKSNVILSEYNHTKTFGGTEIRTEARTYKRYYYTDTDLPTGAEADGAYVISGDDAANAYKTMTYQTSGNFIHYKKRIVDDCYPTNNAYVIGSANYSPAHYWYVKGDVYIYEQTVTAYTGSASAYSRAVHLPLTITAASHGQLQLLNVKPNLYAYKTVDDNNNVIKIGTKVGDKTYDKVWVNNDNDGYALNEVVTWWDWHQMSPTDRSYFRTDTYVNTVACTIDGKEYAAGEYVLDKTDLDTFKSANHTVTDSGGEDITDLDDLFRSSNNIGHDTGYLLTVDMDTPVAWDDRYIQKTSTDQITKTEYNNLSDKSGYIEGPTFTPNATKKAVYGQRQIEEGDIVTKEAVTNNAAGTGTQAVLEDAYVATEAVTYTYDGKSKTVNAGTAISKTEYDALETQAPAAYAKFAAAYLCTHTVKLDNTNYLLYGELKTQAEIDAMKSSYSTLASDITAAMKAACICTTAGGFGGQEQTPGTNYSALETWCLYPESDRLNSDGTYKFNYNYDAFDVLAAPSYLDGTQSSHGSTHLNPHHDVTVEAYHAPYTDIVKVEYKAVFHAADGVTSVDYDGGTVTDGGSITNTQYETVRNDKRHYTKVTVANSGETLYFAKENFDYNGTPYGKGQEVSADIATDPNYSSKVESHAFANSTGAALVQYYCYEDYSYTESSTTTNSTTTNVTKGTVISESEFGNLKNFQQYFTIQGSEPTETTTLYVSRESDIKDVMSDRVYTVVYQYTYYEDEGDNIKQTNELHVINIRLVLETGAPTVGTLYPPGTVLPGSAVGLTRPDVQPGLYEVLTSGWELFDDYNDATHHRNGAPFTNNETPIYWYQNQKAYVAFYSKTYLGKSYSNPVPLSVANYHDLDAVMKDKEHHLYVDHPDVDRASKIYIDNRSCESDATKSELDLLKDFYDLSVLSGSAVNTDEDGLITTIKSTEEDSPFKGHALLNDHVKGGSNLEFILRSNIAPRKYTDDWTPIGNASQCFEGTLHGDGYTVSGLSKSLFGSLCGSVYNLGVTGSFTEAGVANTGDGFVENCWIKTSATSGFAEGTKAVFGNPTRTSGTQLVNCYYPEAPLVSSDPEAPEVPLTPYYTAGGDRGTATAMPARAFYNGEVAYNLNGYYLAKRFYDNEPNGVHETYETYEYKYLQPDDDGTLPTEMSTASYPAAYAYYQPQVKMEEGETRPYLGYVENRFYDGDYRYAGGTIPESNDMRMRTVTTTDAESGATTTTTYYTPIWPDDYLFFGQSLNYGHVTSRTHQNNPSHINKTGNFVQTDASGNRVYRAPAYFRNSTMGVAHFNPAAVFAAKEKLTAEQIAASATAREVYPGMTAIDFSGHNDNTWGLGTVSDGYAVGSPAFYPPLLDDGGLTGFLNADLTKNLLAYTKTGTTAANATNSVVSTYLHDEPYAETDDDYRTVAAWDSHSDNIHGHWVQLSGGNYTAPNDHMLVDREDFNAPIAYQMGSEKRMWYQRTPDNFVDTSKGWEGVSLPFTAEIVTTQTKGELTHFYQGSTKGHEYWLRQFEGITVDDGSATVTANMTYPAATTAAIDGLPQDKEYTNTFLWDYYYYNGSMAQHDANADTYQTYYRTTHTYDNYAYAQAATPYIIGFPGPTYYEFDLSGTWTPDNTATPAPTVLDDAQVITFASATGASIGMSDTELQRILSNGFAFVPTYLNNPVDIGTDVFVLNADGSSFDKVTVSATTAMLPFRPYFVVTSSTREKTRSIVFGMGSGQFGVEEQGNLDEGLTIGARRHAVIVTSNLRTEAEVSITNLAGITVATFTVQPGETVRTPMNADGVYIVRADNGRYQKKLVVK